MPLLLLLRRCKPFSRGEKKNSNEEKFPHFRRAFRDFKVPTSPTHPWMCIYRCGEGVQTTLSRTLNARSRQGLFMHTTSGGIATTAVGRQILVAGPELSRLYEPKSSINGTLPSGGFFKTRTQVETEKQRGAGRLPSAGEAVRSESGRHSALGQA